MGRVAVIWCRLVLHAHRIERNLEDADQHAEKRNIAVQNVHRALHEQDNLTRDNLRRERDLQKLGPDAVSVAGDGNARQFGAMLKF